MEHMNICIMEWLLSIFPSPDFYQLEWQARSMCVVVVWCWTQMVGSRNLFHHPHSVYRVSRCVQTLQSDNLFHTVKVQTPALTHLSVKIFRAFTHTKIIGKVNKNPERNYGFFDTFIIYEFLSEMRLKSFSISSYKWCVTAQSKPAKVVIELLLNKMFS